MDNQTPLRIRMLQYRSVVLPLDYFESQQIGENRQRFIQRAALIMSFGQSNGL
jgi:hypothetical protein